jgi:hypothetical protein
MKIIKESNVKIFSWLLLVVLFIIYFVNADRVYYALSRKSYAVKLLADLSLHAKGDLQCNFRSLRTINNKFAEMVVLNGKITKVANKSGNAKVLVFFRSSNALYEVIENRCSFKADSTEIALNCFASTSGLEYGVYNIGLYLIDDDGEKFVWTNNFFEKVAGGPVDYIARPVALVPTRISEDLKFVIEKIDNENKEFLIQGWTVLDNAEMNDYNAYITFKDKDSGVFSKAFYMPLFTRMDIASFYDDSSAANSGFWVSVPQHDSVPGKHVIKVIIKSRKTGEVIESAQTDT